MPYWLQADPSLHSAAMLKKRFALRHHSLVVAPLYAWWVAAMHTLNLQQAPRQVNGQHMIAFDGYRVLYGKIFRAMYATVDQTRPLSMFLTVAHVPTPIPRSSRMPQFDQAEVDEILADDWQHDCPAGATCLPRESFQDAIFQLADVWTIRSAPTFHPCTAPMSRHLLTFPRLIQLGSSPPHSVPTRQRSVKPEEYAKFLWTLLERIASKASCGCPGICKDRVDGGGVENAKHGKWASAGAGGHVSMKLLRMQAFKFKVAPRFRPSPPSLPSRTSSP